MSKELLVFLLLFFVFIKPIALGSGDFKVVTTFTVIADMARNVAGDKAVVESITKSGAQIHEYQPTPKDIIKIQDANLVLWNGLNLEKWFKKFFESAPKDLPSVVISEGADISYFDGKTQTQSANPHAWMSFKNAVIYVNNIEKALVTYNPQNAKYYRQNARAYRAKILELQQKLKSEFLKIPAKQRFLVTSEGAFTYLAKDFGLKDIYIWPTNADQQGTPQQIKRVIDLMRKHKILVIFSESTVSDKPARQIAAEVSASYGGKLYVDSLTSEKGEAPTYIDMLIVTSQRILAGLQKNTGD